MTGEGKQVCFVDMPFGEKTDPRSGVEIDFDQIYERAIPYDLDDGIISDDDAEKLIRAIGSRIDRALKGPVAKDSPLFDLFPDFPGNEMSHELTDVFRDRVEYSKRIKDRLAAARNMKPTEDAIAQEKGDPSRLERGVLIDTYLSYRAIGALDRMIDLYEEMPAAVKASALARQQLGFALNRRNGSGDRDRAIRVLEELIDEQGDSAETLGILGRIYKDQYSEAKENGDISAEGWLDQAIDTYTHGFEAEPADYYPGVNAINLLLQKGDEDALREVERLTPLVTFAAVRRGGERAKDYWTVATVLELACTGRDYRLAARCLPRALSLADEYWMPETTGRNLRLMESLRKGEKNIEQLGQMAKALEEAAEKMKKAAN